MKTKQKMKLIDFFGLEKKNNFLPHKVHGELISDRDKIILFMVIIRN